MPEKSKQYLTWIDNDSLEKAIEKVYLSMFQTMQSATLADLQRNVVDPFSFLFETLATGRTTETWIKTELQRQQQKSLSNKIGEFHQDILGSVNGWINLGIGDSTGLDIRNDSSTVFAEIKNKSNTLNSSSGKSTYNKLVTVVDENSQATAYIVEIIRISSRPYDKQWKTHPRVRKISGDLFYKLVTGSPTALQDLYNSVPNILHTIISKYGNLPDIQQAVITEIQEKMNSTLEETYRKYFFDYATRNYPPSEQS